MESPENEGERLPVEGTSDLSAGLGAYGYKYHEGPVYKGDVLVIEICGKIVPKRPDDPSPQWFVALEDQSEKGIPLKPMKDVFCFKPRIYKAGWCA